jgi:hypothetical protein
MCLKIVGLEYACKLLPKMNRHVIISFFFFDKAFFWAVNQKTHNWAPSLFFSKVPESTSKILTEVFII